MNKLDVYREILGAVIDRDMALVDILLRAVVLHTHSIVVAGAVDDVAPAGQPPRVVLAPLTRTHLAELLAACFPRGDERAVGAYWLQQYAERTPYELFGEVDPSLADRASAARAAVAAHDLVADLIAE